MSIRLDAPFPRQKKYHAKTEKTFGNPEGSEKNFAARLNSSAVPEDYLEEYQGTLDALAAWAEDRRIDKEKVDDLNFFESAGLLNCNADTHIMIVKVGFYGNSDGTGKEIDLNEIIIRPCAEGHGFYKILLYHLIQLAKRNPKVTEFRVARCYPENEQILLHYGFTLEEHYDSHRDYFMLSSDMEKVTYESWNMGKLLLPEETPGAVRVNPAALPTAEMLNSEAYVERYAVDKDHDAAVDAMRGESKTETRKRKTTMDRCLQSIVQSLESRLARLEVRGSTNVYSRATRHGYVTNMPSSYASVANPDMELEKLEYFFDRVMHSNEDTPRGVGDEKCGDFVRKFRRSENYVKHTREVLDAVFQKKSVVKQLEKVWDSKTSAAIVPDVMSPAELADVFGDLNMVIQTEM
jgi:hypothetical protein